jgi:hypothetical protein
MERGGESHGERAVSWRGTADVVRDAVRWTLLLVRLTRSRMLEASCASWFDAFCVSL